MDLAAIAPAAALDDLQRLLSSVEAQLEAARTANAAALVAHTAARRELQENLDLGPIRAADAATRARAGELARRIRVLDSRIRTCGNTVLGAIAALSPERAPETYGRRGQVRGPR